MAFKRKAPALGLERRVRPRKEDEWDPEQPVDGEDSSDEDEDVSEEEIRGGFGNKDDDEGASNVDEDSESESDQSEDEAAPAPQLNLASVSFGALARAQASLPSTERKKNKTKSSPSASDAKRLTSLSSSSASKDFIQRAGDKPGSSSRKPLPPQPQSKRTSKHAPQEQSSKRPVSRKREIIADPRRKARDPRFDNFSSGSNGHMDEVRASKAYAFLDEYRDSEMADLRAQIKKTKDPGVKDDLKKQLMSMESRRRARKEKDQAEELLREHRRQEKEMVAQGKKPFYLKKSEQKKKLLEDKFAGMSKGQVDKAIARKRKKVAGREKKELDYMQRGGRSR